MAGVEFLPKEYGYVVLSVAAYCLVVNLWMTAQVGQARKKYKIFYPTMYATEAETKDANVAKLFNCIQRGHQNSLEWMPMILVMMVLGGIKHPLIVALLGCVHSLTRVFYFKGYSTGDPVKRHTIGKYGFLAMTGLIICTVSSGVRMLIA